MNILNELKSNQTLWLAVFAWFVAQILKIIKDVLKFKRFDFRLIISSGGMPSSHSSFVTAMTTSIGFIDGFDSSVFAVAAIISMIVMYDAAGVRRAAGKHAQIINEILDNIEETGLKLDKKLKELLGHTPVEVGAGAILGILISTLYYNVKL